MSARQRQRPITQAGLYWTLGALALAVAPHVLYMPVWPVAAAVATALWRLAAYQHGWRLPHPVLRVGLALAGFASVLVVYRSFSGLDAGNALLVLMVAMKLTETRSSRDLTVLMLIALFLVVTGFLHDQSPWLALYTAPTLWVITTAILQVARTGPALDSARALRVSGALLVQAVPVMLVLFVLFPRIPGPFWALPQSSASARTGLSDTMSPGTITELLSSGEVAFRVTFDGDAPPPSQLYWRGPVLRDFDGRTWTAGKTSALAREVYADGGPVDYEITLEPHQRRWLFALDLPDREAMPAFAVMDSDFRLLSRRSIDRVTRYRMRSHTDYRADPAAPDWLLKRDLALPDNRNPRTLDLARQWVASGAGPPEIAERALRMFRNEPFVYTVVPPALDLTNPTDDFLFGTRSGFCEHYASAFTVLMRAAGIPARVVTGYLGGEANPLGDHMTVRQSEAHAWSEIWLEDRGWVRVDPTGAVAPNRIESSLADALPFGEAMPGLLLPDSPLLRRIRYSLDALNSRWNDWVLGYSADKQKRFLSWLGMDSPDIGKMILTLTVLVSLILAAVWGYLTWQSRPAAPPKHVRDYRRFVARLARRNVVRNASEGPRDFARRAAHACPDLAGQIAAITDTFVDLNYHPAPAPDAALRLTRLVRQFRP